MIVYNNLHEIELTLTTQAILLANDIHVRQSFKYIILQNLPDHKLPHSKFENVNLFLISQRQTGI